MRFKRAFCLAISVFLAFAAQGVAQEMVRFDATQPHSGSRVQLRAELFKPDGPGRFPAVVLMHGCGGWQAAVRYALQSHARYLQRHGFVVLNVDSFGPRHSSGGRLCSDDRALYRALTFRTQDAFDAMQFLRSLEFVARNNIFLMGQSNGGAVAIRAAKTRTIESYRTRGGRFRGIVAYYPWCGEFGRSRVALASPLLILAGGRDDWVPARECQNADTNGAPLRVKVYPEAAHSFDLDILPQRYLGKLVGLDRDAKADSRKEMLAFFVKNLTGDFRRDGLPAAKQTLIAQDRAEEPDL